MRASAVTPSGRERVFEPDEIIVSKTDARGFITYANDVFLRVAGYEEDELIGKPHNVIRHPDMPRCVFKLLWDTISDGNEIFAYVKNLARDGAHYWVFAHVTASFGPSGEIVGYHSNRRLPDRSAVDAIRPLYAALVEEERRRAKPNEAMEASKGMLQAKLAELGQTYEEFVWSLSGTEVVR